MHKLFKKQSFQQGLQSRWLQKCSGRHNTILHIEKSKDETDEQSFASANKTESNKSDAAHESSVATHTFQSSQGSYILLATAKVFILDSNGKSYQCRALLDNGSQSNFVTTRLVQKIGLAKVPIKLPIWVNQSITNASYKTKVSIKSLHNNYKSCQIDFTMFQNLIYRKELLWPIRVLIIPNPWTCCWARVYSGNYSVLDKFS